MLYIGVDLGTSAVKLLLMDEKGVINNVVSKEYPCSFPHPGWSEQDPICWYTETIAGLKELLADCDKSQVKGIGVGGQMHGLVTLDDKDEVIRPAILWNDGRSVKEVDYLNNDIGKAKLTELTGNIAFAGFTAPKIMWMRDNEPDLFARIKKIMLPKDYLVYRLSGAFTCDYSDASGMLLLDVAHKKYSDEMLKICGITADQLPELHESFDSVGTLKPEIASELGLSADVVLAAGAGDNAAAAVGTGVVGSGKCNISLGTSGTLFITSDKYAVDPNNALHSFDHANGGYHLMGCMLSAASCNKWWMDEIVGTKDYAKEQEPIKNLGENHVFFLPYLMGERSPHNDPNARGCFIGLTMDSTRADMTQAVLEGVAFATRDMLEAAKAAGVVPERSFVCGGGAKSPLWRRILTNVLNIPLDVPSCEEGPGMGGAILAMVAAGEYATVEAACDVIISVKSSVDPEPELVEKYEKRYQQFKTLYPTLKGFFQTV